MRGESCEEASRCQNNLCTIAGGPCIPELSLGWRRLPSLPYRRRPVGPAGEERGLSVLSTRRVPFVAPQRNSRQGCLPYHDNLWMHRRVGPGLGRFRGDGDLEWPFEWKKPAWEAGLRSGSDSISKLIGGLDSLDRTLFHPRHHGPEALAHLFNRVFLARFEEGVVSLVSGLVFPHPILGELA